MDHDTPTPSPSLAAALWRDAEPVAKACLAHPFVQGIADGTLPRPAFEHYVGQDAFFLDAFARAYALGLARSPDPSTMRRFKALLDGAVEELQLHAGYAAAWGVDLEPTPTRATRAYTDFLLRVATLEPLGHLCAAVTPCMRLYAWIGRSLADTADRSSPYHDWVTTYADEGFAELAEECESLLEALSDGGATTAERYATAMDLELAFFDSALREGAAAAVSP